MENKVVIALDAMGGDYAPVETVKGAVEAVNENKGMKVILVGREEEIKSREKIIALLSQDNTLGATALAQQRGYSDESGRTRADIDK